MHCADLKELVAATPVVDVLNTLVTWIEEECRLAALRGQDSFVWETENYARGLVRQALSKLHERGYYFWQNEEYSSVHRIGGWNG